MCIKLDMKTLISAIIFLIALGFVQNSYSQKTVEKDTRNRAPSRNDLEQMFGQPVSCNHSFAVCFDKSGKEVECPEPKDVICFQSERKIIIRVKFTTSNYAKTIQIFDGMAFWETVRAAEEIMMLNGRGRALKKADSSKNGDCATNFTEEYEFLSINYFSQNCQNSVPGGVTITWKD